MTENLNTLTEDLDLEDPRDTSNVMKTEKMQPDHIEKRMKKNTKRQEDLQQMTRALTIGPEDIVKEGVTTRGVDLQSEKF